MATENSNYFASSSKIICSLLYRCVFLFAEFVIQVKEENGDRHKLHVSVHQSVSHNYSVGGLRPGKNYEITVTAKNRFGESAPSERIKVITDQTGKRRISFSFLYVLSLFHSHRSREVEGHVGHWADVREFETNAVGTGHVPRTRTIIRVTKVLLQGISPREHGHHSRYCRSCSKFHRFSSL